MGKAERDGQSGLADGDIRSLLAGKSARELANFLFKGIKENKAFRRKTLAWLIDTGADQLPWEAILDELTGWVAEILEPWAGLKPRLPDLRELNPVKSAVKNRPDLGVPVYLAIVEGLAVFPRTFGDAPASFHHALVASFERAGEFLLAIKDPTLQREYFARCERWENVFDYNGYVQDEFKRILENLGQTLFPEQVAADANPRRGRGRRSNGG